MSLIKKSQVRHVSGITDEEFRDIRIFLQGAVYCWIKNREDEWFSMRILMGGENSDWSGTPLYCLYEKHRNEGKNNNDAIEGAAKDSGWLLKQTLHVDRRRFDVREGFHTKEYRWIK